MKTKMCFWAAGVSLLFAAVAPLRASGVDETSDWKLKPALLNSNHLDQIGVGLRFEGEWEKKGASAGFWNVYANTSGLLTAKKEANNEGLDAKAGVQFWTTEFDGGFAPQAPVAVDLLGPIQAGTTGTTVQEDHSLRPLVSANLDFGFESDQTFNNSQFVIGPKLGFGHSTKGLWSLLPLAFVSYQRIHLFSADALETLGVPEKDFWRLEVDALWKLSPFAAATGEFKWLELVHLYGDVRYFRAYDIPAKAADLSQKENFYVAGDVSYELSSSPIRYLQEVFIRVAHGRLPPATREDTTVSVGVVFGKKPSRK